MKYVDLSFDQQEADDGNTTYFGGTFSVRPDGMGEDDSTDFYFSGNDRCTSLADQVVEHLHDWLGITVEGEGHIFDSLSDLIDAHQTVRLLLDETKTATVIEPI
jgi:hypothetical protein